MQTTISDRIEQITSRLVPEPPGGIFSNALKVGDQVFLAGMTATGEDGAAIGGASAYEQARVCFQRIAHLADAAGGSIADVVKMTVYLKNMDDRAGLLRARAGFFTPPLPCSTLIGVNALARPDLLVEVDAALVLGAGG